MLRPRLVALPSSLLLLVIACHADRGAPESIPPLTSADAPVAPLVTDEAEDFLDDTPKLPTVEGDAVVQAIVRLGHADNHVMDHVQYLTEEIGPRLTGSHQLMDAERWCRDQLASWGLEARLERWGEVPVGFDRGPWSGGMVTPERIDYDFVTPAWTPGVFEAVPAPAVPYPATPAEAKKRRKALAGAWLVAPPSVSRATREKLEPLLEDMGVAGVVLAAHDTKGKLVHTSGRPERSWNDLPRLVTIVLRHDQHAELLARLESGTKVELAFSIDNRLFRGPVPQHNVIADIPGTEHPDELVIVGGHLDSWDGATGANDNATGVATTMEAARLLMAAGARPKRTIRFMLWSGEEQGLLGSTGYVEAHADEMPKVSAVFVHDMGTNYLSGIGLTPEMRVQLEPVFVPVQQLAPDTMPFELREAEGLETGGSDHTPFIRAGVPGFFWDQAGDSDYDHVHHTQHDTLANVIEGYERHSAMVVALAAYGVANLPALVDRRNSSPLPRRRLGAGLDERMVVDELPGDGVAAKAGWRLGDRVVSIDGEAITDRRSLFRALRGGSAKKSAELERKGKRITTTLDWSQSPGEQERASRRKLREEKDQ
ncbi:M20/M25/M40 family metallo-hydrolase [Paraliomyxa miuraensis]|uniref:M20/M25/M40 family metallo-hydrolase n=1 Tax=Paraliomyxa miuraensis TaxID=376150 RepID=UPI00225C27AD|nr:M20/M25/M40 family metallo-hydrolase [Paraliomyxa miuraensis]MCX4243873.1 M20/M25/M40 family metallo-hydrolase [Paraliomyxa miuraensis]